MGIQFDGINNEIKSQTKIDFPGSVGIAGTLTYEDVANVDSVGIVTARQGVRVNVDGSTSANYISVGAGSDLKIYHDGTANHIVSTNGQINIQTNSSENSIQCIPDGQVKLYYDNALQVSTSSAGLSFADSKKANFGADSDLSIYHDGSNSYIDDSGTGNLLVRGNNIELHKHTGETYAKFIANGAVELYYDNSKKFETTNLGTQTFGDAQFEGNDGTDNALKWDKSDDSLYFRDGYKAQFGTGGDLQIYHDGSHSYIKEGGTGDLRVLSNVFKINNAANNETMAVFTENGSVDLYYNDSKKFETTNDGVLIGDNDLLKFGTGSDAYIMHTGSDFNLVNATGVLVIGNNSGTGVGEGSIVFKSGNNNARWSIDSSGNFYPISNNAFAIGSSSNRVSVIYANTSLNTSDKTLKNTITTSDLGLDFINKLKPVSYKWNQYEGEISDTRTHYGLIAQDVEEVITSSGKTLNDFGGVDKSEEGCMGLAYNQFVSPLIKAVQELSSRIETLEAKVAALEGS